MVASLGFAAPAAKEKPPATYTIPLPAPPDYSVLNWLIGEWSGQTSERGPQGEIHLTVGYDLDKRVMIFRETISLGAAKAAPAASETWMGILTSNSPAPGFRLRCYSSTGFITRYRVMVEGADSHFSPDGGEQPLPGWLFRRAITRTNPDEMNETVQAAPPQKSFFDYYTVKLTRLKSAASPTASKSE